MFLLYFWMVSVRVKRLRTSLSYFIGLAWGWINIWFPNMITAQPRSDTLRNVIPFPLPWLVCPLFGLHVIFLLLTFFFSLYPTAPVHPLSACRGRHRHHTARVFSRPSMPNRDEVFCSPHLCPPSSPPNCVHDIDVRVCPYCPPHPPLPHQPVTPNVHSWGWGHTRLEFG